MHKYTLLLFPLFFLSNAGFSQLLKGKVIGESGVSAKQVSVSFVNSVNKVETAADGSFKIMATKLPDTLIFDSPGYEPYKVVITEKNIKDPDFEVVLLNKRDAMAASYAADRYSAAYKDEVVVVGYGTKKSSKKYKTAPAEARKPLAYEDLAAGATTSAAGMYRTSGGRRMLASSTSGSSAFSKKLNMPDSTAPHSATTRSLTAGEVNDFYKWKMWSDLGEYEFKQWSSVWGISATKRYTVQLQNKDFAAIVNQPVFLINKRTNEKVWSAVTDNTGKAELWAGFNNDTTATVEYMISDDAGHSIMSPASFANGINHLQTDKGCGVSNLVDIAFVVDATGSMGDEIEFLKFEMEDVIRKTFNDYANLDLKVGSVFYRDKGDEYVTRYLDMQSDLLKLLNFVKLQNAAGGGDAPEAVDSALHVALSRLSWRKEARARLLFLFLDAPPHEPAKADIAMLVAKAAAMGVRIIPVACSGSGKSNEYLLRTMALATNGTYAFLTDHSGIGNKHTEASTDSYDVEQLNDLLQRIIRQFVYVKDCTEKAAVNNEPVFKQTGNPAGIMIYPNPTQGNASIVSKKDIKELYIADFTGKLLLKLSAPVKSNWQVNMAGYPSGTYLVKYITVDNKWGAEKLVLIH